MKKKTYTVVFMKSFSEGRMDSYTFADYYRQYKTHQGAKKAMEKYFLDTGFESYIVRGDNRNSHSKRTDTFGAVLESDHQEAIISLGEEGLTVQALPLTSEVP